MRFKTLSVLALAITLAACSEKEDEHPKSAAHSPSQPMTQAEISKEKARRVYNPTPEERAQDEAERMQREAKLHADDPVSWTLPSPSSQPDFSQYVTLKSGTQMLYIYNGNKETPDDALTLANSFRYDLRTQYDLGDETLSSFLQKFASTNDQFSQRDIAKSLEPIFTKHIHDNLNTRYVMLDMPQAIPLSQYDFDKKGFSYAPSAFNAVNTQTAHEQSSSYAYGHEVKNRGDIKFGDNSSYALTFSNGPQFNFIPVEDEAAARVLESYVKQRKPYTVKVYGYVDSLIQGNDKKTDRQRTTVVAIQKLVVVDAEHPSTVLATLSH
ncbi:hypothetical protein [Pseudomonas sp. B21-048]|uniref:hypothetical protein n=1 Tax=Pseudomonas sp. B21-048 TaxID=2895490 RepID=UPI00215F5757|nr:hypothetical protein [Pseudomonas sp. B21-048]UVK98342.1 hypothetical protein LOY56_24075 [Pseudomonas sp. B21-048]